MPKGRQKNSVVLSSDEFHVIAMKMGYKSDQNLRDDLALGLIPPTAKPVAPSTAAPEAEGSGQSLEVARHSTEPDMVGKGLVKVPIDPNPKNLASQKRLSWAEITEIEEEKEAAIAKAKEGASLIQGVMDKDKEATKPEGKTWAGIVRDGGANEVSTELEFIKPGMTVEFSEEEWEEGKTIWKHALIGAVVSFRPSFADVQRWVESNWKIYKPKISHVKPGVYLFEFQSEEDKIDVLSKSWSFYNKSRISLKAWDVDMDVNNLNFDSIRVWIQLPNLKFRFWSYKAISKLASFVGVPVAMDKLTARRDRLGCARILVELGLKAMPPDEIPITLPSGEVYKQPVIYEHMLPKCTMCGFSGHEVAQCRKPRRRIDKPVGMRVETRVPTADSNQNLPAVSNPNSEPTVFVSSSTVDDSTKVSTQVEQTLPMGKEPVASMSTLAKGKEHVASSSEPIANMSKKQAKKQKKKKNAQERDSSMDPPDPQGNSAVP